MDMFKVRSFGKKDFILFWYSPSTDIDQKRIFSYNFSLYIGKRLQITVKWDKR